MRKAFKYILIPSVIALACVSVEAKRVTGIQPKDTPKEVAKEASAWDGRSAGAALQELERRDPQRKRSSLIQEDGLIVFAPDQLFGLSDMTANSSSPLRNLAKRKIPGGSNLCGFIAYNELDLPMGTYRIPLAGTQNLILLNDCASMLSSFRGGAANDHYYVMSYYGTTIQNGQNYCLSAIFDTNNWNLIAEEGDYGDYARVCTDLTFDPTTQRFYGCFLNDSGSAYVLGYMQFDANMPAKTISKVTPLCSLPVSLNGIACDQNGVLYGIRNDNGQFVKINKKTGELTPLASTYFVPQYNGSLTYDSTNDIFYWSVVYDDANAPGGISSAIFSVDKETGALQHVYDFEKAAQAMGLYTEFSPVKGAPGQFDNMSLNFEGESLSGTVTFDAPSTFADGSQATGNLTYTLSVVKSNGYEAAKEELTCKYGEKNLSVPISVLTPGNYTFTLKGYNDAGNGYPTVKSQYLGVDLPNAAENLKVNYSNGTVTVTWDEVNSTLNGGYFDPNDVTYEVTLSQYDENGAQTTYNPVKVATTSATYEVNATSSLNGFQATVTPFFGKNQGDTTPSPVTWIGALEAPFKQTMTASVDGWSTYTIAGYPWEKYNSSDGKGWACPYYWGNYNNSWLFSPKIKLEKGRYYTFTFTTWATVVDHTLHAFIGSDNNPDAMTTKLADYTVKAYSSSNKRYVVTFGYLAPEDGLYNIGFWNDTASSTWTNKPYCWINDVTCEEAPDSAPAAPELTVDYNKSGEISADVTIVVPTKTFGGEALNQVDNVTLNVAGANVQTWTDVKPGQTLTYSYEGSRSDDYTFIASANLEDQPGVSAFATVHLGMVAPLDPEWVNAIERSDKLGTIDVTWAPVNQGINGQEIADDAMEYNVINVVTNSYVQKGIKEPSYEWVACEPDQQNVVLVSVNAQTAGGTSSTYGTYSNQSLQSVGVPYKLPVRETFEGGYAHYSWIMVNQHSAYDAVYVVTPETAELNTTTDANGDGYLLMAFVPYANSSAGLYSGRIDIPANANQPILSFAVFREYYSGSNTNKNQVQVGVIGSKTSGYLAPVVYDSQNYGWQYYYYDMSSFKGQTVNLLFTFSTNGYTSHYLDDIHFFDAPDYDLAISDITVPELATPNTRTPVVVTISNLGAKSVAQGAAKVVLRRVNDNTIVGTTDVPSLSSFQATTVRFTERLNNSYDSEVKYVATLEFDKDSNADNNTREATVNLEHPFMPAPQNLEGERNDNGFASLTWNEPDLSPDYMNYSIGFEDSTEPSTVDLGGFKSVDRDGNEVDEDVLGISGVRGFTTFPHSSLSHSGNWMIVSPCNADGAAKEDWLISPELSGFEQTLRFYARTNWSMYESFSVLISTTGDEVEDFTQTIYEGRTSDNNWNLVEVKIPEGARYFAILCKADDTSELVYLMLDDFEFEGADRNYGLQVEGYNTYRNNEKVMEIGNNKAWEDLDNEPGLMYYRVTARYGEAGESGPSNEVFLFTRGSGIDSAASLSGKVYSEPGRIIVEGADGLSVSITDLNGIKLFEKGKADSKETINVSSGIYIVTIDGKSVKLSVR